MPTLKSNSPLYQSLTTHISWLKNASKEDVAWRTSEHAVWGLDAVCCLAIDWHVASRAVHKDSQRNGEQIVKWDPLHERQVIWTLKIFFYYFLQQRKERKGGKFCGWDVAKTQLVLFSTCSSRLKPDISHRGWAKSNAQNGNVFI